MLRLRGEFGASQLRSAGIGRGNWGQGSGSGWKSCHADEESFHLGLQASSPRAWPV